MQDAPSLTLEPELKELSELLGDKQLPTAERLSEWKSRALVSSDLFNHFVFGVIEWDKTFGRPTSATLADGFEIEAWWWDEIMEYTLQGVRFCKLKSPTHVSSWDGKGDEQTLHVYFIISSLRIDQEHFVEIRFNPQVGWTPRSKFSVVGTGFRVIQPNVIGFRKNNGTFLPIFKVVVKRIADL
ncbi:MAG TPA: hypothetical protein VF487_13435 [Chitinophagaceae bacterium]